MIKYLLDGEQSERLLFRKLQPEDAGAWLGFLSDAVTAKYLLFAENTPPEEMCTFWFERVFNRYKDGAGGLNALIEKSTGRLVGQGGLLIQQVDGVEEMEVSYHLLPEFRGKGFASEAARKCRDYAFANNFSDSLISVIHVENIPSQRVALSNGMTEEKQITHRDHPVKVFRIRR
jgi:[ribosomal protein S5]-alanine N-acetyltransferase